jgi:hypothetical protein
VPLLCGSDFLHDGSFSRLFKEETETTERAREIPRRIAVS